MGGTPSRNMILAFVNRSGYLSGILSSFGKLARNPDVMNVSQEPL